MTDRPIIFSAPMVRALLDGRKAQTRRVLKPQPGVVPYEGRESILTCDDGYAVCGRAKPKPFPYAPGDRLWVREAFAKVGDVPDDIHACPDLRIQAYYRADAVDPERQKWRSPIHMPRWASRLTLLVTDVRVQRLQEISAEDATAEGIPFEADALAPYEWSVSRFADLWNSIHGPEAWDANPWVAAISFIVHRGNIDAPMTPTPDRGVNLLTRGICDG